MLPAPTEKLWIFLKEQPSLHGFTLVGGSALSLKIGHRLSEDLDFTTPASTLPTQQLDLLVRLARDAGFDFDENDDEAALDEFTIAGMELHDFQQDYIVDHSVKVSFFTADEPTTRVLRPPEDSHVRVASVPELFATKALVSASRSKSRDWLDLFVLMRDHGFTLDDYRDAFQRAGIESTWEIGINRLCSGRLQADDEGYLHLLDEPPQMEEITAYFVALRDEFESEAARHAAENGKSGGPP